MPKTRSLSLTIPAVQKDGYYVGASSPFMTVGPLAETPYEALNESLYSSNSGRTTMNPCLHKRWERTRVPVSIRTRDWRPEYSNVDWNMPDGWLHQYSHTHLGVYGEYNGLDRLRNDAYVNSFIKWDDLSARAWDAMYPTLSQGFSALNFLYELQEARSMFDLWNKKKSTIKNIAGGHLNYSFGWLPFVSDVKKLLSILSTIAEKIRDFEDRAGKLQRRHFRAHVPIPLPPRYETPVSVYGEQYVAEFRWLTSPVYSATAVYTYTVPDMPSGLKKTCLQYLNAFGVGLDPEIIWEAVPYSFVVDWFFGVGDFLHRIRKDVYPATVTLLDFCHSVKFEAVGDHMARQDTMTPATCWVTKYKYYNRMKAVPAIISVASNSPNVDKLALASSLIITRNR